MYFDTNKAIAAAGAEGAYPPVERTLKLREVEGVDRVSHVAQRTG